jgi:hypothetical protein
MGAAWWSWFRTAAWSIIIIRRSDHDYVQGLEYRAATTVILMGIATFICDRFSLVFFYGQLFHQESFFFIMT